MWQTDWAEQKGSAGVGTPQASMLSPTSVGNSYSLLWVEHCIECAIPDCYNICPLYVARRDRKCARFKQGISPNPQYPGLFPFGAEIEFRRWGKLESTFGFGSMEPNRTRLLDRADRVLLQMLRPISASLRRFSPGLCMNGAYAVIREKVLHRLTRRGKDVFDEFVIEVWNLQIQAVRLVIECWQQGLRFRTSIVLDPGRTLQRIPAASMNVDLYGADGMIRAYPENDAEAHLVFSWLDFVRYRHPAARAALPDNDGAAAENAPAKVKCVIWDLDNTLWDGILGEQEAERISLRPEVLRTMVALDERGILQSIASKNDHDGTWQALNRLGVAHLFLYPQINWEPKSANIQRIVNSLNIGMDSCVFIDDSSFERAEVKHELPEIRVLSDSDVPRLLSLPEFDVPVTAESRQRRAYYVSESQRKEQALEFGDRYEAFLKTCGMEATLFIPTEREHVERCLELLQRSNQLNLSPHRYTAEEFAELLKRQDVLCICASCRDRFGDYGIVGFASITMSKERLGLKDFVLSCRVAQKKVENAWFGWLTHAVSAAGYSRLYASYVKTPRNSVLLKVLLEVGFVQAEKQDTGAMLELDCGAAPPASEIVSVAANAVGLRSPPITSIAS